MLLFQFVIKLMVRTWTSAKQTANVKEVNNETNSVQRVMTTIISQRRRRLVPLLFEVVLNDVGAVEGRSRKSAPLAWRNM